MGPRLERRTLDNGLRVVVAPDSTAPVVGVAVYYDVGFRSEPEGRTGFAHLFEHLMFQGSTNIGKMEHPRLVQGNGGVMNGSTRPDYTNYYEALPSSALELALFLEADRMGAVALTQENLDNQVAVVQNEIRVNVENQPYGGFPWIELPPVMFDTFANSHNGYGDFSELEAATLDDARAFWERYYAPGNAVLTVAGDVEVDAAMAMIDRHFGVLPAREVPVRPSFAEPPLAAERRAQITDALAPTPALVAAWRVPHPVEEFEDYLAHVVLTEVLTDGDASRLQRRLLLDDQSVTAVSGYLGTFGDPFDSRDPSMLQLEIYHPAETQADTVLSALSEEIDRVAEQGLEAGELARVGARLSASLLRSTDQVLGRTLAYSVLEQQRSDPGLLHRLPELLGAVGADAVQAAAGRLRPDNRAVLELVPGSQA